MDGTRAQARGLGADPQTNAPGRGAFLLERSSKRLGAAIFFRRDFPVDVGRTLGVMRWRGRHAPIDFQWLGVHSGRSDTPASENSAWTRVFGFRPNPRPAGAKA